MIKDFYDNKIAYKGLRETKLALKLETWQFVDEYYMAFKPIHEAMIEFQSSTLSMSDMIIKWLWTQFKVKQIKNRKFRIPTKLYDSLVRRSKKLTECNALVSALVLDPRISWSRNHEIFNFELRDRGIHHIERIFAKINQPHDVLSEKNITETQMDCDDLLFENFVSGKDISRSPNTVSSNEIGRKVLRFTVSEPRISARDTNFKIIDFWHLRRDDPEYTELYKVSQVVFGAPATQVKVERDFSTFAIVYNHLRTRISDEILNSIFVAKFNSDLLKKVDFVSILRNTQNNSRNNNDNNNNDDDEEQNTESVQETENM